LIEPEVALKPLISGGEVLGDDFTGGLTRH